VDIKRKDSSGKGMIRMD